MKKISKDFTTWNFIRSNYVLISILLAAFAFPGLLSGNPDSNMNAELQDGEVCNMPTINMTDLDEGIKNQIGDYQERIQLLLENPDSSSSEVGRYFGLLGMALLANSYNNAALESFQCAINYNEHEFRWHYFAGVSLIRLFDLDSAKKEFEISINIDPDYIPAFLRIADISFELEEIENTREFCQKVLDVEYNNMMALSILARVEETAGNFNIAIDYLNRILQQDSGIGRIQYRIGQLYRKIGDFEKAKIHLALINSKSLEYNDVILEEIKIYSHGVANLLDRAKRLYDIGEIDNAILLLEEAKKIDPDNHIVRNNLGSMNLSLTNKDIALSEINAAIGLNPVYAQAYFNRGIIYTNQNRYHESIEDYLKAIEIDPNFSDARFNLANNYRRINDQLKALDQYQEVIKLKPSMVDAYIGELLSQTTLKNWENAKTLLDNMMQLFPNNVVVIACYVRFLSASPIDSHRNGRIAVELGTRLLQHTRSSDDAAALAMAYAESGNFEMAIKFQTMALNAAKQASDELHEKIYFEALKSFENKNPLRAPWSDIDPVISPK